MKELYTALEQYSSRPDDEEGRIVIAYHLIFLDQLGQ